MVVSHLTRSHWRKVNGEETEQMKSYQVFVGGGTNLDLSVSAVSIVERNKEPAGPGATADAYQIPLPARQESITGTPVHLKFISNREITIPDNEVTNVSRQEVIFVH